MGFPLPMGFPSPKNLQKWMIKLMPVDCDNKLVCT